MPKLDIDAAPRRTGSIYPAPFDREVAGRGSIRLGDAGGLTQFGANIVILPPGGKSSLRHWHEAEDEFVMVTEGELVLIEDAGEAVMRPGECAAFPAGRPDGHHFVNRSGAEARFLVVGTRAAHDVGHYADVDLRVERTAGAPPRFTLRDGTPYTAPGDEG